MAQVAKKKPYMIAMDGKKVAMGLTKTAGDVDMFGHEDSPTLSERKNQLDEDLLIVEGNDRTLMAVSVLTRRLEEVRKLNIHTLN